MNNIMRSIYKVIISLMLLTAGLADAGAARKFDRGLGFKDAPVFMPKGQLMFGGTVSYQDYSFYDYKFIILDDMNISAYTLSATPSIYYTFAKNMAVGLKFSYKRTLGNINETNLSLTPDLSFGISDYYMIQHTYSGSLSYRYYIDGHRDRGECHGHVPEHPGRGHRCHPRHSGLRDQRDVRGGLRRHPGSGVEAHLADDQPGV